MQFIRSKKITFASFLFFLLFILYFVFLQIGVRYVPAGPDQGYIMGAVKLILEKNQWPVVDFFEMHGPNQTLFFLLLSLLVGLKNDNILQAIIFINMVTMFFVWFHCQRNFKNFWVTISVLVFCMFNAQVYWIITGLRHNVLSCFLLTGSIVILGNYKECNSGNNRRMFLAIASFLLGFSANTRPQYLVLVFLAFIWLILVNQCSKNSKKTKEEVLIFLSGVFVSSLYSLFFLFTSPSTFIQMHLSVHKYMSVVPFDFFDSQRRIFFDFLLLPELVAPFIFSLASSLICLKNGLELKENKIKFFFQNREIRFQILAFSFAVTILAVQFIGPDISRLVDSVYFWALSSIPFLNRILMDNKNNFKAGKFLIYITILIFSITFIFVSPHRPSPLKLYKNREKFNRNDLSWQTIREISQYLKKTIEPGNVVLCDPCIFLTDVKVDFLEGMELPNFNFILWKGAPKELLPALKIISEETLIQEIKKRKAQYAVFPKNKKLEILKYFVPIKEIKGWVIYALK
jgi:hypothetical protein